MCTLYKFDTIICQVANEILEMNKQLRLRQSIYILHAHNPYENEAANISLHFSYIHVNRTFLMNFLSFSKSPKMYEKFARNVRNINNSIFIREHFILIKMINQKEYNERPMMMQQSLFFWK